MRAIRTPLLWASVAVALVATFSAVWVARQRGAAEMETMKAYLLDGFQRAKAWDVSLVEAIPDSAMRWAPTEGMRDFAQQVAHAANNLFIARAVFGQSGPDLLSESDDSLLSDSGALMEEVVAAYDWIINRLDSMPASALAELTDDGSPRWRTCVFALEHAMWTRGQLVPYLHAHGVTVPLQRLF